MLLRRCWSRSPQERPQAVDVVEILAHNPELISPCLDAPTASVEVLTTGNLELPKPDRARGHSLSSVWQSQKHMSVDQTEAGFIESTKITINAQESGLLKHGFRVGNKKTLHESFKKKTKKESRKDKLPESFILSTNL